MSYRCEVCRCTVRPGLTRRTHVVERQVPNPNPRATHPTRAEIAREIPVCGACNVLLVGGLSLAVVTKVRKRAVAEAATKGAIEAPKPQPPILLPQSVPMATAAKSIPTLAPHRIVFGKASKGGTK